MFGAGTRFISSVMCYGPALAIFHNGHDSGFNITMAMLAIITGVLWDVGVETDCNRGGGYAISGGTLNTVDGDLSIMIDEIFIGTFGRSNTTCTATSVGISVVPDSPRHFDNTFYFPQGKYYHTYFIRI